GQAQSCRRSGHQERRLRLRSGGHAARQGGEPHVLYARDAPRVVPRFAPVREPGERARRRGAGGAAVSDGTLDVVGIGIGPFNLGLAALGATIPGLRMRCFDKAPRFDWHPGIMIPGATLQVPFLADLVTAADPTNPFSFLAYMKRIGR